MAMNSPTLDATHSVLLIPSPLSTATTATTAPQTPQQILDVTQLTPNTSAARQNSLSTVGDKCVTDIKSLYQHNSAWCIHRNSTQGQND